MTTPYPCPCGASGNLERKDFIQARVPAPLFWRDGFDGELANSPKQLKVVKINKRIAVELNSAWHSKLPIYDTGFCLNATICFGAVYRNVMYAVAIWSNPVSPALPQHSWLELRRMAISDDAPRNTASYMISKMAKFIKLNLPEITTLVSYQDLDVHTGTIYKASNWIADSIHQGGSWNRPNSKNQNGKPRTRPDRNNATGPKRRWIYKLVCQPK